MSNIIQRLLLFFVGLPALVLVVLFLPFAHHAAMVLLVLLFTVGSAVELSQLFKKAGIRIDTRHFAAIGFGIPLLFFASTFLEAKYSQLLFAAVAVAMLVFFSRYSFAKKDRISESLSGAAAYAFGIMYPGVLGGFAVLIVSGQNQAVEAILSFIVIVIANDSLAWLFGTTLGRRRNIFAVSPNKSIAGFFGGLVGSCGGAMTMQYLYPGAFPVSPVVTFLLGLVVGLSVIAGDLFESALKRSVGIKDSGAGIPGRGGFLDSFDSEFFAAPVFYAAILLLDLFR